MRRYQPFARPLHGVSMISERLCWHAQKTRSHWRMIYRQEARRLLRAAHRIVGKRDIADDVIPGAFIQVWHEARSFDPVARSAEQIYRSLQSRGNKACSCPHLGGPPSRALFCRITVRESLHPSNAQRRLRIGALQRNHPAEPTSDQSLITFRMKSSGPVMEASATTSTATSQS